MPPTDVWALIQTFLEIAIGRRGPDSLPASHFLLGLVAGVYFLTNVLFGSVILSFDVAVTRSAIDVVASLAFVWVLLSLFERKARFAQTATAFLGLGVLLAVFALPLADALTLTEEEPRLGPPEMAIIALQIWWFGIAASIVSRAIAKPYVAGLGLVIVFWLAIGELILLVGPESA